MRCFSIIDMSPSSKMCRERIHKLMCRETSTQVLGKKKIGFSILHFKKSLKEAVYKFRQLDLVTPIIFFIITMASAERVNGITVQA